MESNGRQTRRRSMGNNGNQRRKRTGKDTIDSTFSSRSPATLTTLARIQKNRRGAPQPGSTRSYFDNTSPSYGWLLPGWVAEERVMESGRLYKYFYDPSGYQYRAQEEVLYVWEEAGLIVLDL